MANALDLSKYIVNKCIEDNYPISNLQLQKILYYIQRKFVLLDKSKPAFYDEIEAWKFGPVVPNVYYHYCGYGAMEISMTEQYNIDLKYSSNQQNIINDIVEEKRMLDPWELVQDTHKPNSTWSKVFQGGKGEGNVIPIDLILEDN